MFAYFGLRFPRYNSEIITPKYKQAMDIWRDMHRSEGFRKLIHSSVKQPTPLMTLLSQHCIGFRSFEEPDSCLGSGLILLATDESSDMGWEDIERVLLPKVFDLNGSRFHCGTVKGENGWLWKKYKEGLSWPNATDTKSWLCPTKENYVRFGGPEGAKRYEEERAKYSDTVFKQQFECVPIANQAAVFKAADLHECTRKPNEPQRPREPRAGMKYVAGIDLGRTRDYTAIVILEWGKLDGDMAPRARVVHAQRFERDISYLVIAHKVAALCNFWKASAILDATGGATGGKVEVDSYLEDFRARVPYMDEFFWGGGNKLKIIDQLALAFQKRQIVLYTEDVLMFQELELYEYVDHGNYLTASAPAGFHDDFVAAIAQAWHGIVNSRFRDLTGIPLSVGVR